ncbi:tetratricopeptide repeat protein [Sphingomonas montana]|uniref:tetratricopeptide repeat protein n=1 Tax=Sphingomonas montana TaxID=1843236 RepID=UPI0009FA7027|nr:tetratricopeptide repeat protein [Sphingomonas montana]
MKIAKILMLFSAVSAPVGVQASQTGSAIRDYVRARAADADDQTAVAARGYGAVLARNPGDPVVATRAYRQAISAGDRALALAAAAQLDRQGLLPPDARVLMLADAVDRRDWTVAQATADAIVRDKAFSFLVPALRAWISLGSKQGDPIAILDTGGGGAIGTAYAGEQRALLMLASGRTEEGIAALRAQLPSAGPRQMRLRLASAALLMKQRKRAQALAMLDGDTPMLVEARARIGSGKALPAPIDSAAAGIAELLVRVAIDINRERPTPIALGLARTATFLAPDSAETWLVTAELLLGSDRYAAATDALTHVADDDPFAASAREARLSAMVRRGENEAALQVAEAAAARAGAGPVDWSRVGDVRAALGRSRAAAEAYGRAAALATPEARWPALLLQGSALEEAGDWAAAKPVLERAHAAAPDQAVVLNLLGYAQLERRENLAQAQALIERASLLRPDDASITDSLGWAYYLRGNTPKAIATLERAVLGDPGQTAINEHLGDAYWSAGRRFEARYAWSAALVGAEAQDLARLRAKIDGGWTLAVAAP